MYPDECSSRKQCCQIGHQVLTTIRISRSHSHITGPLFGGDQPLDLFLLQFLFADQKGKTAFSCFQLDNGWYKVGKYLIFFQIYPSARQKLTTIGYILIQARIVGSTTS